MRKLEGIYPALVTPYTAEGDIDKSAVRKLTERLLEKGVHGFYIGGSTGESYLLSMDERKTMLEAVFEVCKDKCEVIANIGMMATRHSVELAKHAEQLGVTAISSVPPFYFSYNMEEYCEYYNDLTEAVELPVLVYNIPAMSGVKFSTSDLDMLLANEKIMGLKHTSYDLFQLQQLIQNHPDKTMFVGHDELFLSALAIGARAGIGSTFNIMPDKFLKLIQCYDAKNMDEAIQIQGEINAVVEVLCKVGVFKGIKEVLRMQGYDCGLCRKPFRPLNKDERALVKSTAEKYKLI